jgi:hypothetical protein
MYEFMKIDEGWLVYWGPPPSSRMAQLPAPQMPGKPGETAPVPLPAKLNRLLPDGAPSTAPPK